MAIIKTRRNYVSGVGLLDVDRVEVLKGPQGTLFGRNAMGGLVSIITRKSTKELSAQAGASYGSYDDIRPEAGVGGPISDMVQMHVAGLFQSNNAWVKKLSRLVAILAASGHGPAGPSSALSPGMILKYCFQSMAVALARAGPLLQKSNAKQANR